MTKQQQQKRTPAESSAAKSKALVPGRSVPQAVTKVAQQNPAESGGGEEGLTLVDQQTGEVIATCPPLKPGTSSQQVSTMLFEQSVAASPRCKQKGIEATFGEVCHGLKALDAKTGLEAMLCAQMFTAHNLAMDFMRRATLPDQTVETANAQTNRAVRLMTVFLEQAEALQRLRGKSGHQSVRVEHVHVHDGGQAIVGAVSAGRKRLTGEGKNEKG